MENNEEVITGVAELPSEKVTVLSQENLNSKRLGAPDISGKPKFKLKPKTVYLDRLNINHPFHNILDINPNEYYSKEFNHFAKCYDMPFVALFEGEYFLLSHREEVMAAKNCGKLDIKVLEVIGLEKDDLARFMTYRSFYGQKGYKIQYDTITWLEKHFRENKRGKEWADEIPGDMKKKLATILGVSESTIQYLKQIGDNNREDLIKLDNKETSLTALIKTIRPKMKDPTPEEPDPVKNVITQNHGATTPVKYNGPGKEDEDQETETQYGTEEANVNMVGGADGNNNNELDLDKSTSESKKESSHTLPNGNLKHLLIETEEGHSINIKLKGGKITLFNNKLGGRAISYKETIGADGTETHFFKSTNGSGSIEVTMKNLEAFV